MNTPDWHQKAKDAQLQVRNFIDGAYSDCLGDQTITKHSARDGKLLYQFAQGTGEEVDHAVASAKAAFADGRWSELTMGQRKSCLNKLADLIEANSDELALNECLDVGKPIALAIGDVHTSAWRLRDAAANADKLLSSCGTDGGVFAYQTRKPLGVTAAIVGWNFPLSMGCSRIAPALVMGNTMVIKPSEFTALSTCRLAELAIEAGIPPGVFNVVNGAGNTVGDALARHRDVALMSFVGSSATGKQIMKSAGDSNMKRLILECGGKSPFLVFDDCAEDLDFLAEELVDTAITNQGEVCVASTRVILQAGIREKILPKIIEAATRRIPQDPLNSDTTFGAMMNEAHMNKVLGYIEKGKQQGAKLILGGRQVNRDSGGFYIEPTIFDHVDPNSKIAQEEIFGPVIALFTVNTEEEAIQIANNSDYGLAAYAATRDASRIQRLSKKLNAGYLVMVSTSTPSAGTVGLGMEAHKQSGFGMEGGVEGLKVYSVTSTVNLLS